MCMQLVAVRSASAKIHWRLQVLKHAAQCAQVACGAHHCLVATRSGAVYSWGLNTDSQLGHGRLAEGASFLSHPRPIDALAGQHISQVALSASISFIWVA